MKFFLLFLSCSLALPAFAAPKPKAPVLPYLGPGADKLSKTEYERIYKNYIQTSILLGYPFLEGSRKPCDQALDAVFREAGMFGYPVPPEAQQVRRSTKKVQGHRVETYEMGGMILQLTGEPGAPERLIWVNSSSPKASLRLSQKVRNEVLTLETDPVTGLQRVKGIPVGYPHPFLNPNGQGLYVRILTFKGQKDSCRPDDYFDNNWDRGFDLSNARCQELKSDAERVWSDAMSPKEFQGRELARMKLKALKHAMEEGASQPEAEQLVKKHFVPPYTNEINVVGAAMRNLAQCNLLALGKKDKTIPGLPQGTSQSVPGAKSGQ